MSDASHDLTPLADRLAILQVVRVATALGIFVVPALAGLADGDLAGVALAYAALIAVVEIVRRSRVLPVRWVFSGMLLADGMLLALAVTLTGGAGSPLLFLMLLEVLAVTLLGSARSGVKLALWCALLIFLGQAAVRAGIVQADVTASDLDAALAAGALLAIAVVAAACSVTDQRALRESRAQLTSLVDLDRRLAETQAPSAVSMALAQHLVDNLGFARAVVVVRSGVSWIRACADDEGGDITDAVEPTGPNAEATFIAGSAQLVRSLDPTDRLASLLPDASNLVLAPMVVESARLGLIAGEWGDHAGIPVSRVEMLDQAVAHAAFAMRHLVAFETVERLASRDALTGLLNRRSLDDALRREMARAQRSHGSFAVIVLDVDHFKAINDRHGHPAGDGVLREVALGLEAETKAFDVAIRLGGDEFVILLSGCGPEAAPTAAERLRVSVRAAIRLPGVTLSAGVACWPGDASDASSLVVQADAALYRAKRAGRDRTASTAGLITPTAAAP